MGVLLGLLSAILYGGGDFFGGWATRKDRLLPSLFVIQLLGLTGALILLATDHPSPVPWLDAAKGLAGGSVAVFGLALLFTGMSRGSVGVVAPLSAVGTALVPMTWGIAHGERPGAIALLGAAIAMAGVGLVAWEPGVPVSPGEPLQRGTIAAESGYGVGAGLGFGMGVIFFSTTSHDAGFWPVAASKLGPVLLVGGAMVVSRARPWSSRTPWPQVAAAALGDIGATTMIFLALRRGLTSIVAPVSSIFPTFTVLLARLIYHEHLTRVRAAGLGLTVLGLVLLAL